jgi:transposase
MTRAGLEGFGRSLASEDEVVIEATGNAMEVVRMLKPYVARVIVVNPLQVKAITHARIKTDKTGRSKSPDIPSRRMNGLCTTSSRSVRGSGARTPQMRSDAEGCAAKLAPSAPALRRAVARATPG